MTGSRLAFAAAPPIGVGLAYLARGDVAGVAWCVAMVVAVGLACQRLERGRQVLDGAEARLRELLAGARGDAAGPAVAVALGDPLASARPLPGVLVLLGLLGTFTGLAGAVVGATQALGSVAVDVDLVAALAGPLGHLGVAFGTSVAGVGASLVASLVLAGAEARVEQEGRRLQLQAVTLAGEPATVQAVREAAGAVQQALALLRGELAVLPGALATASARSLEGGAAALEAALRRGREAEVAARQAHADALTGLLAVEAPRLLGLAVRGAAEAHVRGLAAASERMEQAWTRSLQEVTGQAVAGFAERLHAQAARERDAAEARLAAWEAVAAEVTGRLSGVLRTDREARLAAESLAQATLEAHAARVERAAEAQSQAADGASRAMEGVVGALSGWSERLAHWQEGLAASLAQDRGARQRAAEAGLRGLSTVAAQVEASLVTDRRDRDGRTEAALVALVAALERSARAHGAALAGAAEAHGERLEASLGAVHGALAAWAGPHAEALRAHGQASGEATAGLQALLARLEALFTDAGTRLAEQQELVGPLVAVAAERLAGEQEALDLFLDRHQQLFAEVIRTQKELADVVQAGRLH